MPEHEKHFHFWKEAPDDYKALAEDVKDAADQLIAERGLTDWPKEGHPSGQQDYSPDDSPIAKAYYAVIDEAANSYLADLREGRRKATAFDDAGKKVSDIPMSVWQDNATKDWLWSGSISAASLGPGCRGYVAKADGCSLFVPVVSKAKKSATPLATQGPKPSTLKRRKDAYDLVEEHRKRLMSLGGKRNIKISDRAAAKEAYCFNSDDWKSPGAIRAAAGHYKKHLAAQTDKTKP